MAIKQFLLVFVCMRYFPQAFFTVLAKKGSFIAKLKYT